MKLNFAQHNAKLIQLKPLDVVSLNYRLHIFFLI